MKALSRLSGSLAAALVLCACGSTDAGAGDGSNGAGAGGADAGGPEDAAGGADGGAPIDAEAGVPDGAGPLVLTSTGFLMVDGELVFPAKACSPIDESPPFSWTGAPAETMSFALTFVDTDNGATKWVVWDIPKTVTMLPENVSKVQHPPEVPGATQLGSLGHVGYAGPGVPGPPMHTYEFVIWALDVEALPGTAGLITAQIRATVFPMHQVAISEPLVAKGQLGGP